MKKSNRSTSIRFFPYVFFLTIIGIAFAVLLIHNRQIEPASTSNTATNNDIISGSFDENLTKSDEEWKRILSEEQYWIIREQGTEQPFTGDLLHNKEKGVYVSVGCNQPVFHSEDKYDSGTGWPSFTNPIGENAIVLREDTSLGYKRVEVLDRCGGHLGHVFDDGPQPTGKRYCINSLALKFIPQK